MESRELALRIPDYTLPGDDSVAAEESAQILKKAVAGDRSAFEQIVLRHQRHVFMTAFRLLGHAEDAQDAAQDVLLRLYRYAPVRAIEAGPKRTSPEANGPGRFGGEERIAGARATQDQVDYR